MLRLTGSINEANAITHSGVFHADEVFATVILLKIFKDIVLCRVSSVPEGIKNKKNVIVYDIGLGKFDHHQKDGNGVRENGVPYASAGLIWKEYGKRVLEDVPNKDFVWDYVDREFIQGIDATDNGIRRKNFFDRSLSLSQIIFNFNPFWDSNESENIAFLKAVKFAEVIFDRFLESAISISNAKSIVEKAIENSKNHIMVLDRYLPWQEFLFNTENVEKAENIWFVIFPSKRSGYSWNAVPTKIGGKDQRKAVPESWFGLSGVELCNITGVKSAIFCHKAGFMGSARTLEDTIKMATIAVNS